MKNVTIALLTSTLFGTAGCALAFLQNPIDNQLPPPLNTFGTGDVTAYFCNYGDFSYEIENAQSMWSSDGSALTYAEAVDLCDAIAGDSLGASVYCEWKGQPVYLSEANEGDCDTARFGGEPGDGICGLEPELNIIGSYTSRPESGFGPTGDTNIHIDRLTPQVLVLSTYESTTWNITAAPGAQIQKIIVTGLQDQLVNAPPGIPVEVHSVDIDHDYILGSPGPFPDSTPFSGGPTAVFFHKVEALTGLEITSYHNCYHLTDLTLHGDLSATSNCTFAVDQRPYYDEGDYTPTSYIDPDCNITPIEHFCGDGVQDPEEECDNGYSETNDDCTNECRCVIENCGGAPECEGFDANGDGVINNESCHEGCLAIDLNDDGVIDEYDCNDEDYCEALDPNGNGIPDTVVCGENINDHCTPIDTDGDGLDDLFDCDFD
jgi:hypothetical protein